MLRPAFESVNIVVSLILVVVEDSSPVHSWLGLDVCRCLNSRLYANKVLGQWEGLSRHLLQGEKRVPVGLVVCGSLFDHYQLHRRVNLQFCRASNENVYLWRVLVYHGKFAGCDGRDDCLALKHVGRGSEDNKASGDEALALLPEYLLLCAESAEGDAQGDSSGRARDSADVDLAARLVMLHLVLCVEDNNSHPGRHRSTC